ncbi:MAG: hypothetical protein HC807_05570 [Gammaproteobacteria bacterium]|nr:hypothetical protein [Gammaproteobacteria bacterium]
MTPMNPVLRYGVQAVLYVAFGAALGYFSSYPVFRVLPSDHALVRLSLSHGAQPVAPCYERTPEELAKLAPNQRVKRVCPRERSPVRIEIDMDGEPLYRITAQPAGLKRDGTSTVYRRLPVVAGKHAFEARLADGPDGKFGYTSKETVDLAPGKVLVIDFHAAQGGFRFVK